MPFPFQWLWALVDVAVGITSCAHMCGRIGYCSAGRRLDLEPPLIGPPVGQVSLPTLRVAASISSSSML